MYIPPDQSRNPDYQLVIPSALDRLGEVENITEKVANEFHIQDDDRDNLAIAVTELTNNAIIHGNKFDPQKPVVVSFYCDGDAISVYIKDSGRGFDLTQVESPLEPENIMKESGRGLFILRSIMDEVLFNFSDQGTVVKIKKRIKH